jgi:hypothetical protein
MARLRFALRIMLQLTLLTALLCILAYTIYHQAGITSHLELGLDIIRNSVYCMQ